MARWAAAVLALVGATHALSMRPVRPVAPRRAAVTCVAPGKVELKQKVSLKTTANPGGGGTDDGEREFERKNVEDLEDPKMFNVILLGDEEYTQEHICKALLDVVEDVQIKQAEEIFLEAQKAARRTSARRRRSSR